MERERWIEMLLDMLDNGVAVGVTDLLSPDRLFDEVREEEVDRDCVRDQDFETEGDVESVTSRVGVMPLGVTDADRIRDFVGCVIDAVCESIVTVTGNVTLAL